MYEIKILVEEDGDIVAFRRRGNGREGYEEISIDRVRDDICLLEMEFIHFWEFLMNEAEDFLKSNADGNGHEWLDMWLKDKLKMWKEKNKDSRML